ncbi:MAG: hypothetical protein GF370_04905 [Candidatus Nealsonbacteria bacterium]|nr:hypothetical protein [Candidatus Nealsonbacteria bacterium]
MTETKHRNLESVPSDEQESLAEKHGFKKPEEADKKSERERRKRPEDINAFLIERLPGHVKKEIGSLLEWEGTDELVRINMDAFKDYTEEQIESDRERAKKGKGEEDETYDKAKEKFKLLTASFFKKYSEFIPIGSSEHDTFENNSDILLFDPETGKCCGALSILVYSRAKETPFEDSTKIGPTKERIDRANLKGGIKLKYGLEIGEEEVKTVSQERVCIVPLEFQEKQLKNLFSGFDPSNEKSETEEHVFRQMLKRIKGYIDSYEKKPVGQGTGWRMKPNFDRLRIEEMMEEMEE